ncbi:hypothetical protein RSAG8_02936, partial [Rhizoctonia solani AG-8 WAC10335]
MPYHSRPLSEAEIDSLPLRFVKLEQGEQETFTNVLLQVWFALAESGSLATLPPVPDIVSFVDDCTFFYLIFHTHPDQLKLAPQDRLTSTPPSPPPKSPSPNKRPHPPDSSLSDEVIGCVYLSYAPSAQSTLNIGIALRPEARGKGFGRAAITKFLRFSFDTLRAHRVVANVFGPSEQNQQQSARESGSVRWIFEKLGFVPEGVQRRAAFSPAEGIWRDVYPLAMLDVDWVRLCGRGPKGRTGITCPFEAMIERQTTEQEEMSEWMEDPGWGGLRRVSSTETIKGRDEQPSSPSSSFTIPSEHDWRSATPSTDLDSTDADYSLDPPLSPGFSSTSNEIIELASLSPSTTPAPYIIGPLPTSPQNGIVRQDGHEPLDFWPSDSDFDGSER